MRRVDENRAENFIKKHQNHKKWIAFALCIALLTGSGTLYMLNKPATAMTEEGAKSVGLVLETADSEYEQGLIEQMENGEDTQDEEETSEETVAEDNASEEVTSEETVSEEAEEESLTEDSEKTEEPENEEESEDSEKKDKEKSDKEKTDKEKTDKEKTDKEKTDKEKTDKEKTDKEKADKEKTLKEDEEKDSKKDNKIKTSEKEITLSEDVVLTANYVDQDGETIADERQMKISESFDPSSEASEIEGYTFKEAKIDGVVITFIAAKQDEESERKFFEVTTDGGDKVELKEDKTVVLTYLSDDAKEKEETEEKEVEASVKLTAKYVDKNGEEIKDSEELKIAEAKELGGEDAQLEGYFFDTVTYEEKEIIKVAPILKEDASDKKSEDKEEKSEDKENAEDEEKSESEEAKETVTVKGYTFTTAEGEEVEVTEDAEISFNYLKASEKTEFTFSDSKVSVKATVSGTGIFPEGIELKAKEVTKNSSDYNYDAYLDALNDSADAIANKAGQEKANEFTEDNTLLYDIAFVFEGKEIQPKEGSVSISIDFKKNQLSEELSASSEEEITVVHLPIKEEVKAENEITNTDEARDISSNDIEVITLTDASAAVDGNEKVEFQTESFSVFAVTAYPKNNFKTGTHTYEDVLGDAVNFGIISYEVTVSESQTNIATQNLVAGGQFGNNLTNAEEQTFIASRITGNFNLKGNTAYFVTPSEYKSNISNQNNRGTVKFDTSYTSAQLDSIVEKLLQYTRSASADLAQYVDDSKMSALKADRSDKDKFEIDITNEDDNSTVYITLDSSDMEKIRGAEKLRIYKKSGQRVVFNVTAGGNLELYKYGVSNDGGSLVYTDQVFNTTGDSIAQSVIWNFINASQVTTKGSVAGVFISGRTDATWINEGTSSGWLAFPKASITSGEWHNTYNKIKRISGTAEFQAYKTIDSKEATVSGFKFTLYKKDGNSWTEIETVTNDKDDPHSISFEPVSYGDNKGISSKNYQYTDKDTDSFIYKIVETQGYTDENGNAYTADDTVYYAKVEVTKESYIGFTETHYYRVSDPVYYTDEACNSKLTDSDRPVFNNTTGGNVGFVIKKYLNNQDPGEKVFNFTVKVLKRDSGKKEWYLETVTNSLKNDGDTIAFSYDKKEYNSNLYYEINNVKHLFFVVIENDSTDSNIEKDESYIIVKVTNPFDEKKQQVKYFRYSKTEISGDNTRVTDEASWINTLTNTVSGSAVESAVVSTKVRDDSKALSEAAFYNKGKTMLRIHKTVVNNFGADNVRNKLLQNVVFRITDKDGNRIVFTGFLDAEGVATEYPSGKTYPVYYNGDAQWTITGLSEGDYTVEEVADGKTFTYDPTTNVSSILVNSGFSRVTKYVVTEDPECPTSLNWGVGGSNYRIVFAADLSYDENSYKGPSVTVGGSIKTVQVLNFYSMPIGPIKVSKNFFGGRWTENMPFTFAIEGLGYEAYDSDGNKATYSSQPMPVQTEVTVTGENAVKNKDGSYSNEIEFTSIPFKYAGTYYYKITEKDTGISGVTYDGKEIYVKVEVKEKQTRFTQDRDKQRNPLGWTLPATRTDEIFFYLGADVTYYSDASYSEEKSLAKCELTLGYNPGTGSLSTDKFVVSFTQNDVSSVAFNNTRSAKLSIKKVWQKIDRTVDSNPAITALDVVIQRRIGTGTWEDFKKVQLSPSNGWVWNSDDNPDVVIDLEDSDGNAYQYRAIEDAKYLREFSAIYTYGGVDYPVDIQGKFIVNGQESESYSMVATDADYGQVTITNKRMVTNSLPSTGGMGTGQFAAIGGLLLAIAVAGLMLFRRREHI